MFIIIIVIIIIIATDCAPLQLGLGSYWLKRFSLLPLGIRMVRSYLHMLLTKVIDHKTEFDHLIVVIWPNVIVIIELDKYSSV